MSGPKKVGIRSSKRGLIFDKIDPREFNNVEIMYCCEQCSHLNHDTKECTIGYDSSKYLREIQLRTYNLCGRMAMCRFQEID